MPELQRDMMIVVLSRLPVKSLLRFRCLSKPWCFLLDSPHFVLTHINQSLENHTNLTLIVKPKKLVHPFETALHSFNLDDLQTPIPFDTRFNKYHLLSSCNGLLLLKHPLDNHLVLFNPSTRNYRSLPPIPISVYYKKIGYGLLIEKYGLGYDSVNDIYKVVTIVKPCELINRVKIIAKTMVYSLKSNYWRETYDFPYYQWFFHEWGAGVNCALHMVVAESYGIESRKVIGAFDLMGEKFYIVPKPVLSDKEEACMDVCTFGGCLGVVGIYENGHRACIWVMTDYGVKESWKKSSSINFHSPSSTFKNTLCCSKSSDEVLITFDNKWVLWYDLKKGTIRAIKVHHLPNYSYANICVRSLVHLHGNV